MFLGPLSEIFGRRIVLTVSNCCFVSWMLACALAPNLASLIVFRLLSGLGASGSLCLGPGVVSDLFAIEERGLAMSMFSFGTVYLYFSL